MLKYHVNPNVKELFSEEVNFKRAIEFHKNYKSCYHPKNILLNTVNNCYKLYRNFQEKSEDIYRIFTKEEWNYAISKEDYEECIPVRQNKYPKALEMMEKFQKLILSGSFVLLSQKFSRDNFESHFDEKNVCSPSPRIHFASDRLPERTPCIWDIEQLNTLHCTNNSIIVITSLLKVASILLKFLEKFVNFIEISHDSLLKNKSDKKSKTNFQKLVCSLKMFDSFIYTILLIIEDRIKVNEIVDVHSMDFEKKQIGLESVYMPYSFERQSKFIPSFLTGLVERSNGSILSNKFHYLSEEMMTFLKVRVPKIYKIEFN